MTNTIIPNIDNYDVIHKEVNIYSYCSLKWRREQLLVKHPGQLKQPHMPSLETESLLIECLKHSLANLIRIDPKLGEDKLKLWADACAQASKPLFLSIPSAPQYLKQANSFSNLQRCLEWSIALMLLVAVTPLMLMVILLMSVCSPGPILSRQWHIGKRGRLFQPLKFRTAANPIGKWMLKYGLDNLPQLFNVLRGEMSLIGPRCCTLEDAVHLTKQQQKHLNKLPGIIGSWLLEAKPKILHLDSQTFS